jgi:predicted transcriptional regulator
MRAHGRVYRRAAILGLVAVTALVVATGGAVAQVGTDGAGGIGDGGGLGDLGAALPLDDPLVLGAVVATVAIVLGLGIMGGTKFITPENVLENESRRRIFDFIKENPGTHLRATADALDLSTTNVLWHLRKLEDAELVNHKKFEGYKLLYPTEGGQDSKKEAIASAVLRNENAQAILEYAHSNPGAHQRAIARALDVNHGTVRWHLRKLEEAGLVDEMEKEYTTEYYVTDLGEEALTQDLGAPVPTEAPEAPETAEGTAEA